ncbi:MAG: hypothetical protein E6Q97_30485 [Desulfurellales bacterium]|nr:MAG: hypothetical protein E6Q97_30485 [Desulfurellales bacterium]
MKYSAFDQGQTPTIALINQAKNSLGIGVDIHGLTTALQLYVDKHFAPVWGTPCRLVVPRDGRVPKGAWAIVFLDSADVANALGYHDLTPEGLPLSKVFVRTTIAAGELVSVTASHELAEMLVDPALQLLAAAPNGWLYAYETADAVEADAFKVNGLLMSNFVYPSWFEGFRKPRSTKFDHMGLCKRPFEIRPGGYMPVMRNGRWDQIFGSTAVRDAFRLNDHPRTHARSGAKKPKISRRAVAA